ncbi:hypothetical protein CFP56_026146 [Quercus suber]|uniref:Uncharacterized protein n=1 Tax=Quercus suber TaxID=58331 RepID=A0AAW0K282_QUESU
MEAERDIPTPLLDKLPDRTASGIILKKCSYQDQPQAHTLDILYTTTLTTFLSVHTPTSKVANLLLYVYN